MGRFCVDPHALRHALGWCNPPPPPFEPPSLGGGGVTLAQKVHEIPGAEGAKEIFHKAPKLIYAVILWYRFVVRPPPPARPPGGDRHFMTAPPPRKGGEPA